MAQRGFVSPIHLLNSDEKVLDILDQTNKYLTDQKDDGAQDINEHLWAYRSLIDLVPETVEQFWSGHTFPLTEGEYELESSIVLSKLGFYTHAISALRNVLELGCLSVYWDIRGPAHIDAQGWLRSLEVTPFRRALFAKLKTNTNIRAFHNKHGLLGETENLYKKLCDFAHTRGIRFSSRALSQSNVNTFNHESLKKWLAFMTQVVRVVVAFHVLRYPVGLQDTPIDDKFGLNGPVGGFLQPFQAERIRNHYPPEVSATLQKISDNDSEAKEMAAWVIEKPDLTEEEWREQIETEDKREIEAAGFDHWLREQKQILKQIPQTEFPEARLLQDDEKMGEGEGILEVTSTIRQEELIFVTTMASPT